MFPVNLAKQFLQPVYGVQSQGKNYLIPVDADIPDEKRLLTRAVDKDMGS